MLLRGAREGSDEACWQAGNPVFYGITSVAFGDLVMTPFSWLLALMHLELILKTKQARNIILII